jgi:uncharacterized protein (DUF488 family)
MSDRGRPSIWTVGHGRRTLDELAGVFAAHAIDEAIDIRRYPASRHNPQFARGRLTVDLPAAGIGYRWSGDELGGRRRLDPAGPSEQVWHEASFRAFAQHLRRPEAQAALIELIARARVGERLSLMCAETLWWRCHRRLVADALVLSGIDVFHIIGTAAAVSHPLTHGALLDAEGLILYEATGIGRPPGA